ncbi:hypothetical protein LX32DRAFT_315455 [Colletotrichum zoysiae]|uniref:Uncharacterized protein n=1 Tax=Colletotrichum zoysiae TaxID=1216348 RepID=A0AAD9H189_9PEZI|nr:hypothetical protein LX32DRAFT_315455 [Colletotrichum zoysiae]
MERVSSVPPSYSQALQSASPQDDQALPLYRDVAPPSYSDGAPTDPTTSPYRPFPAVMNGYYSMAGIKTLFLCGASRDERLFFVKLHMGLGVKAPLGARNGLLLRNGTSSKDAVIAAAGDDLPLAARVHAPDKPTTIVHLPPLEPRANTRGMDTEVMRAGPAGDDVVFLFSVEVGERQQRERFEWREIKKRGDDAAKPGGFRLVQVSNRRKGTTASTSCCGAASDAEVLALLLWSPGLSKMTHPFSLQLQGRAMSMGSRWSLTVVATALRLWELYIQSKVGQARLR